MVLVTGGARGVTAETALALAKAFKPALGVRVAEFRVAAEFVTVGEAVFAHRVEMFVRGRAFGLKKITQDERYEFENFTPPT